MNAKRTQKLAEKLRNPDYVAKLTELVHGHPCLWDESCTSVKFADKRFRAWRSICSSLISHFDEDLCLEEKSATVKLIKHKWYSIRDLYLKSLHETTREELGSGRLYAENVNFLISDSKKTCKKIKKSSKLDAMHIKSEDGEIAVEYDSELLKNTTNGEAENLIEKIANKLVERNEVSTANKEEKSELDIAENENILNEGNSNLKQLSSIISNQVTIVLERCDANRNTADGSIDCKVLEPKNVKSESSMDKDTADRNMKSNKMDDKMAVNSVIDSGVKSAGNEDFVSSTESSELDGHVQIVSKNTDETKSPEKMHSTDVESQSETVMENGERKFDEKKSPEVMQSTDKLSSVRIKQSDKGDIVVISKRSHGINGEKKVAKQNAKKSKKLCAVDDDRQVNKKDVVLSSIKSKKSDKGDIAAVRKKSFEINGEKKVAKQKAAKSKKLCTVDDRRRVNKKDESSIGKQSASKDFEEEKSPKKIHSTDAAFQSKTDAVNRERKLNGKRSSEVMHSTDNAELSSVRIKKSDKGDFDTVRKKSYGINGEEKAKKSKKLCSVHDGRQLNKKNERNIGKRCVSPSFPSQNNKKCKLEAIDTIGGEDVTLVANQSRKHPRDLWREKLKTKLDYPIPPPKLETVDEGIKNPNLRHNQSMGEKISPSEVIMPSGNRSTDHSNTYQCNHLIGNLAPSHEVRGRDYEMFSQNKDLDEDEQFFMSIMSSVKQLSELEKIYFRMSVIQLVRDIRKRSALSSFAMGHDMSRISLHQNPTF